MYILDTQNTSTVEPSADHFRVDTMQLHLIICSGVVLVMVIMVRLVSCWTAGEILIMIHCTLKHCLTNLPNEPHSIFLTVLHFQDLPLSYEISHIYKGLKSSQRC